MLKWIISKLFGRRYYEFHYSDPLDDCVKANYTVLSKNVREAQASLEKNDPGPKRIERVERGQSWPRT